MKKSDLLIGISLCVLFAVFSIAFRFESLFTSKILDYEWHSSTVLRHIMAWDADGAFSYNFVPPVTFSGTENRHINNHSSIEDGRKGYSDEEGIHYYVSYPPFGYIAPYVTFSVLGVEPTMVGIRLFNVFTQVLTAGVLFWLVYRVSKDAYAATGAFAVYLFSAISFFIHAANYMSDMFVQLFFVCVAAVFYEIVSHKLTPATHAWWYVAFAILFGLMMYTEWLALGVAFFLFWYGLYCRRRPYGIPFILIAIAVPACVLLVTIAQYMSVSDASTFFSVITDRYTQGYQSSTLGEPVGKGTQVLQILGNYGKWFGAHLFVLLGIVLYLAWRRIGIHDIRRRMLRYPSLLPLIGIFTIPVLVHHLVFFNWTSYEIHFFSVLKTVPLFALVFPLLGLYLWHQKGLGSKIVVGILCVGLFAGSLGIHAYHMRTQAGADNTEYCDLGTEFKNRSSKDEVLFVTPAYDHDGFNEIMSSVIVLCAERNFTMYRGIEAARELMRQNGVEKGVIFYIEHSREKIEFVTQERISL